MCASVYVQYITESIFSLYHKIKTVVVSWKTEINQLSETIDWTEGRTSSARYCWLWWRLRICNNYPRGSDMQTIAILCEKRQSVDLVNQIGTSARCITGLLVAACAAVWCCCDVALLSSEARVTHSFLVVYYLANNLRTPSHPKSSPLPPPGPSTGTQFLPGNPQNPGCSWIYLYVSLSTSVNLTFIRPVLWSSETDGHTSTDNIGKWSNQITDRPTGQSVTQLANRLQRREFACWMNSVNSSQNLPTSEETVQLPTLTTCRSGNHWDISAIKIGLEDDSISKTFIVLTGLVLNSVTTASDAHRSLLSKRDGLSEDICP